MKRIPQYSIRTALALTLVVAALVPIGVLTYPRLFSYFNPASNELTFPDLDKWEADFEVARIDRNERSRRLLEGMDSVDDAMERLARHDFVAAEQFAVISGWIMTTDSGARYHRATLQRQAQIFQPLGDAAVLELLKWLEHDQIEIRFIASYALGQLTGLKPHFPHFATLEQLSEHHWFAETRLEYETYMGAKRNNVVNAAELIDATKSGLRALLK